VARDSQKLMTASFSPTSLSHTSPQSQNSVPDGLEANGRPLEGAVNAGNAGKCSKVRHECENCSRIDAPDRGNTASSITPSPNLFSTNPCLSCVETPCCRRLPLEKLSVRYRRDLESVLRVLRHRWFEIGLKDDGTWMLFYQQPCRNLDLRTGLCTVHGTPQQPWTCKKYPSHHCWYQRVFNTEQSLEFIRFDARRVEMLMEMVSYDVDTGEIADVPSWEEMIQVFSKIPLDDPGSRASRGKLKEFRFPVPPPLTERHIELFRFRQQFPGVRILKGKREWVTVVDTYEA